MKADDPAPVPESVLEWMFESLGPFYGWAIPVTALLVFFGACLVVVLSRRRSVIAAYLVFLPLPFALGVFGSIHGLIYTYQMVSISEISPNSADFAGGLSAALVSSYVSLAMTFPSYLVLAIGLFLRSCFSRNTTAE